MTTPSRAVPVPTPETEAFWAGTVAGELRLPRCRTCERTFFPPQRVCPTCRGTDVETVVADGRAHVVSAVVSHLKAPGLEPPFVLAVVELDDGARMLTNVVGVEPSLDAVPPGMRVEVGFEPLTDTVALPVFQPSAKSGRIPALSAEIPPDLAGGRAQRPSRVAIVGAAESTDIGKVPHLSSLGLAVDAALRALDDCGLTPADVDGVAMTGLAPYLPVHLAGALGIEARWVDGTMVGGCANLVHVRHAAAAIAAGLCDVVLVAHGESGRSHRGGPFFRHAPDSWAGQFELPFGTAGPMTLLTLGTAQFLAERGLDVTTLAEVVVAQREWASRNPRALRPETMTVDDVLAAKPIADPYTQPMCCVVTDAGGALVLTSVERARDLPRPPVHVLGAGEANGVPIVSRLPDLTSSAAFRRSGADAFGQAGIGPADVQHAMLYDAVAVLPLMALEDLGFVPRGGSGELVASGATRPGGSLPVNTTGGGLAYTHSGIYGIHTVLESVRQLRGEAAAQVPDVEVSVAHAIGGMFQAAATLVLGSRPG